VTAAASRFLQDEAPDDLSADSFSSVPVNQHFGFALESHDETTARVSFRPSHVHSQEYGLIHGGLIATLADTAAVYTIYPLLAETQRMASIEFKINFLAGARATGGALIARARLVRKGKSVAVVHVDVEQDEVQIATGLFTYLIRDHTPPE
jgi:uncharacterized protein (TIGR00369 family)